MATFASGSGVVKLGANTVAEVNGFSYDEGISIIPDDELTDTAETHLTDRTNWSGSIECHWDDTDTNGQQAMTVGASISIAFQPEGATTGDASVSGTATIESIGVSVQKGSTITRTFSLKGSGPLVHGTAA